VQADLGAGGRRKLAGETDMLGIEIVAMPARRRRRGVTGDADALAEAEFAGRRDRADVESRIQKREPRPQGD
jgi:hypothetical protein